MVPSKSILCCMHLSMYFTKNVLSSHHNFHKFVIAEGFVTVLASCSDDGHHLVLGQLVPYVSHQMFELQSVDVSRIISKSPIFAVQKED